MTLSLKAYGYHTLNIETIAGCNMNCRFCSWDRRQNKQAVLPNAVVYRLVDEVIPRTSGCVGINFSQFNEPLLDKRLFDFVAYTKERGIPVILVSNGLLLGNEKILEKMLRTPPDKLTLSVQTLEPEMFGHLRGVNMDFARYASIVYKFLSAARNTSMQITLDMACNFLNSEKQLIRRLLGFSAGDPNAPLSLDDVYPNLSRFLEGLTTYDPAFDHDPERLRRYMKSIASDYATQPSYPLTQNIHIKIKKFMYGHRLQEFKPTMLKFACAHPTVGVLASGDVVPCCHMASPLASVGNVLDHSLEEVLKSSATLIKNLRGKDGAKPEVCRRCFGERTRRALLLIRLRQKFDFNFGFNPLRHG